MKIESGTYLIPKGFRATAVQADIKGKPSNKEDLMMIVADRDCMAAGVFTKNSAKSGAVLISQAHLSSCTIRGMVGISGNANACVPNALSDAEEITALAGDFIGVPKEQILLAMTGKIGVPMQMEAVKRGFQKMSPPTTDQFESAARAIMTSDTFPKVASTTIQIGRSKVNIMGISKGNGMIHPNMATTLSFVMTDARIQKELLQRALSDATLDTFNMIDVDSDMSTNDTILVLASGEAGNEKIADLSSESYLLFFDALRELLRGLAKQVAGDAEGSKKLLICNLKGAGTKEEARALARSVVSSIRFKASMGGRCNYWGRIPASMGATGIPFDLDQMDIHIRYEGGCFPVFLRGAAQEIQDELTDQMTESSQITISIQLQEGQQEAEAYGCDLQPIYVENTANYG